MLNHQLEVSLPSIESKEPSVLALWFYPIQAPLKPITKEEAQWAHELPTKRSRQYQHSRGYVREALSEMWDIPALKVPLNAAPGKPPELEPGWGNISFSHCSDRLLIGWSPKQIGVDIERADRCFKANQIQMRYFSEADKKDLINLKAEDLRAAVLKKWVIKEAAIKWQKGDLASGISQWRFCEEKEMALHQSLELKINLKFFHFENWYIAIAFNKKTNKDPIIICQN